MQRIVFISSFSSYLPISTILHALLRFSHIAWGSKLLLVWFPMVSIKMSKNYVGCLDTFFFCWKHRSIFVFVFFPFHCWKCWSSDHRARVIIIIIILATIYRSMNSRLSFLFYYILIKSKLSQTLFYHFILCKSWPVSWSFTFSFN